MNVTQPNERDAETFCIHCQWVCKCWSMNVAVFKAVNRSEFFFQPKSQVSALGQLLNHNLKISGHYAFLQVAKLHDNPSVGRSDDRRDNLSIEFFLRRRVN